MPVLHFLKYNNAVPIGISIMLLGAGGAFAYTDPGVIYSASQQVVSIDNTYLVNKDLTSYSPSVRIAGVTEDTDYYYVAYKLSTIDLKDSTWQDVTRDETMQVSKSDLGPYRDLGLYATEKFRDIIGREVSRLRDTQEDARTHVSQKVVATEYGGLVGKFLDGSTQELPGYSPVVQEELQQETSPSAATVQDTPEYQAQNLPGGTDTSAAQNAPETQAPQSGPVLQVLGNNPTTVNVGTTYSDLGAIIAKPFGINLTIHVAVNGREVQNVTVDTAKAGDWTIDYSVTDTNGNTGTARRVVHVVDPNASADTP